MFQNYTRIGETVYKKVLSNGLPVIVIPKKGFRKKYAMFATKYGGMDMRFKVNGEWHDTPAGIAHYLEHKMFDTEEGNALQDLATNGAEPNAFTSNAITCYYFDCIDKFYDNLKILLSFVSIPYFTEESVQKEQGIIGQEICMIEDNPDWQVYKNLMQALYKDSPIKVPVAGSVESISHITAKTLYDCHNTFYTPSNMCLVVVGDVEVDKIVDLAAEILPKENKGIIERDYGKEEILVPAKKIVSTTMDISERIFYTGFKCKPETGGYDQLRNNYIGDLACDVLVGGSSVLYSKLYSEGAVNGSFESSYDILPGAAYLYFGGECKNPDRVTEEILTEAKKLCSNGIDAGYFTRIKNANFGSALKSLNSFESIAVSMIEAQFHDYDSFMFPEIFDSIKEDDIIKFISENFDENKMTMSVISPKE